jgi:nucleotide-binding universal stress UspA family protein
MHDSNAASGIVNTAEHENCDMIFMGSHGRSGWSRLLLGSVASKVLPLAHISVRVHKAAQ